MSKIILDKLVNRHLRARRCLSSFLLYLLVMVLPSLASAQQFTATSLGDHGNVTVMQTTGVFDAYISNTYNNQARQTIVNEYYKTHTTDIDFVVIFSNFNYQALESSIPAFYTPVKNDTQGIGSRIIDSSWNNYGQLQGVIDMGNIANLESDPLHADFEKTLYNLAHTQMHRWGAYVNYLDAATNSSSNAILSSDGMHWNFYLDSTGSTLYGNHWRDNGDGTFTSIAPEYPVEGIANSRLYSPLDLYLMGMYDKSQVPPLLLIKNPIIIEDPHPEQTPKVYPQLGVTVRGTATYVTIDQIIAAMGERVPSVTDFQKTFKAAFIFITNSGTYSNADLQGIEAIRSAWTTRFSVLTDAKAIMTISSTPTGTAPPTNPGTISPPISQRTAPFDMNDGVTWLKNRQQSDGHWEDLSLTAQRDTAESLLILKNYVSTQQNCLNGISWLAAASSGNTDYVSRSIITLSDAGRDVSVLVNRLISEQNAEGGWSGKKNFVSNPADTGFALKALAAAGYANAAVISRAIDFLKAIQNSDGGWGVAPGQGSGIQPTARTLSVFKIYRGSYPLESNISSGIFWLEQKQNSDGGFGPPAGPGQAAQSTVYDTASSVIALYELNASTIITDKGLNYLRGKQSGSGSWNESAYQTASAMNALWKADLTPDLSIVSSDITISPATVTSIPANVTIHGTIWNNGNTAVPQATVALYDGDPVYGEKVYEQTAVFPSQVATNLTFSTTITDANDHTFFVSIDPRNAITEKTRTNNIAWKTLTVQVTALTVGFASASSSGSESTASVKLQVSLSGQSALPATVDYLVNGASTATSGADYTLVPGTLTFAPGETTKFIDLHVVDDLLVEPNETVVVDLANPVNAVLGRDRHTYTIVDNDVAPQVTITSPVAGIIPTNAPQLLYTVIPGNATVTVKVDGNVVNKTSGNFLDPLSNGPHTVRVEASDGINTGIAEVTFTLNFVPPVVTIRSPISSVYTATTPTLRYQVDKPSTITVKVDHNVMNKVSGDRLDALADGEHTVRVEAIDAGGIIGWQEVSFIVSSGAQPPYELRGSLTLGNHPVAASTTDIFGNIYAVSDPAATLWITKYGETGTVLWDVPLSTNSGQWLYPAGITVDSEGSAYVFLDSLGGLANYGNVGAEDTFLVKYDKDGALGWVQRSMATTCSDLAYSVFAGQDGCIYAAGVTGCGHPSGYHAFWRKFDKTGVELAGAQMYIGNFYSSAGVSKVTVDLDGNVYIAGYTDNSVTGDTVHHPNAGGEDYFVMRFDKNSDYRWAYQGGTAVSDRATGLAVDDLGGVYVSGITNGGLEGNASHGSTDTFIAKIDSSTGVRQWTTQLGTAYDDTSYGITAEKNGIIYVAGSSYGTLTGAEGSGELFVVAGDGSGSQFNQYWIKQFGTNTGTGEDIMLGNPGHLFVREGATLYKLRDPRLPSVTLDHNPMWSIGSSVTITGTIDPAADIFEVKTDTGAAGGLATYPTATTWQDVVTGLLEGKNEVAVTAKNSIGFKDTVYGTIMGSNGLPPSIITTFLPYGVVGTAYNQNLAATDGRQPYTWSVISGSLPDGVSLDGATGLLSGTPTSAGTSTVTFQVMDALDWSSIKDLSISIYAPLTVSTTFLPTGKVGTAYNQTLSATGGLQPYVWSIPTNTLPTGLNLSTGGVISGTPQAEGTTNIIVQVTDKNKWTSEEALVLTISNKSITAFSFASPSASGVIDEASKSISVTLPYGTDASYLVPSFTTTGNKIKVGSIVQTSGITANNFTNPVIYTVIAADGSTAAYTVTVSVAAYDYTIITVAGYGVPGFTTYGLAINARIPIITGVAVDILGNFYIAAPDYHRIGKVDTTGTISSVAGYGGGGGFGGDGAKATLARLNTPMGVAVDSARNIYIADTDNQRIRKVNYNDGIISTIAGTNQAGFSGEGVPATQASLNYPTGVAVDGAGNIYIADTGNQRIRKVSTSGTITTIAGNGEAAFSGDGVPATDASLNNPASVAVDSAGNIYIADTYNHRIRKVSTNGIISTVAGNGLDDFSGDGVPATETSLFYPASVAVDGAGNIYIADTYNQRIRKVDAAGIITTICGNGEWGFSGDGYPASQFSMFNPQGVAVDTSGNIYIADTVNFRIRKLIASGPVVSTAALPPGTVGVAYNQTLKATGGSPSYTWTKPAGSLPTGLTLSTSGLISQTPTTAGTYTFTVQVKDTKNATNTKVLTISVYTPLSISTSTLASGSTGTAYSQTLAATGGALAYSWSTTAGMLPAGLALNETTGVIFGTPISAGTSTITFKVTDATTATKSKDLRITISASPLSITTTTLISGTTGTPYSQTLAAKGGSQPYLWSITAGSLSSGLTLSTTLGIISGTPISAGTSTFTIQVKDASNTTSTKSLSISVFAPLSITTTTLSSGITGSVYYSQALAVTGGLQPYIWSTTTGTLPAGLSLIAAGVISGTPLSVGTSTVMFRVTDANLTTATKQLSISVVAAPTSANGDVNGDGVVDAGDVVLAQRIAMGIVTPSSTQLCRGDVAPAGAPDGVINAADVVVIQRKAMGLP